MRRDTPLTPNQLLIETGEALYGPRWQSEMARDLNCALRTVQRWASGQVPAPASLTTDLKNIATRRRAAIDTVIERLD
jgi:hypothetical protein